MSQSDVFHINTAEGDRISAFPDPRLCTHPDGLLAWGGDCEPTRLLSAYRQGIFPWYEEGGPCLWWSPDPRMVFDLATHKLPRRLTRQLRHSRWVMSFDQAFDTVIRACAEPRQGQPGTWITPAMIQSFNQLHALGWAHSIEIWAGDELIGGLYGLAVGRVFCAESKFHRKTNASKAALGCLLNILKGWSFDLVDSQVHNPHLVRLGAIDLDRTRFLEILKRGIDRPPAHPRQAPGDWGDVRAVVSDLDW
jgi:leucyl/phenylalanyl-tRNA--protein transferase